MRTRVWPGLDCIAAMPGLERLDLGGCKRYITNDGKRRVVNPRVCGLPQRGSIRIRPPSRLHVRLPRGAYV